MKEKAGEITIERGRDVKKERHQQINKGRQTDKLTKADRQTDRQIDQPKDRKNERNKERKKEKKK